MKPEERAKRADLTAEIMETAWYKQYFQPEMERKAASARDIKHINDKEIEKSYLKQIVRADVYSSVLNMMREWVSKRDLIDDNEKEDK